MRLFSIALAIALVVAAGAYLFIERSPDVSAPPAVTPAPAAEPAPMDRESLSRFERWYEAQPRYPVPVSNDGAIVLIVKFTDYQCGGCAWSHTAYAPVLAKWERSAPGAVKLVEKNFPLNPECNKSALRMVHPAACAAAAAAVLAGEQRRDGPMKEWLYANGGMLTPESVRRAAASIGHVARLDADLQRAAAVITADTQMGRMLGVSVTPTFFINGVKMARTPNVPAPAEIDAAIAWEMKKAGKLPK